MTNDSINTKAFVLRQETLNGDGARVALYTEAYGKIDAIAPGLRKAKSKLAAHLEPITFTEVFLIKGRRRVILAGSVTEDRYLKLKQNIRCLYAAGLVMRLVELMAPFENRDPYLFQLLKKTLSLINQDQIRENQFFLLPYLFAWKLLVLSGYRPELAECLRCRERSISKEVHLHLRRGGTIHRDCLGRTQAVGIPVDAVTLKGLHYMAEAPMEDVAKLRAKDSVFEELAKVIELLVEERFEVGAGSRFWTAVS